MGKAKRAHHVSVCKRWWARREERLCPPYGLTRLRRHLLPGSEIMPLATSLFQMNNTTSAPMVAVMKPAP